VVCREFGNAWWDVAVALIAVGDLRFLEAYKVKDL